MISYAPFDVQEPPLSAVQEPTKSVQIIQAKAPAARRSTRGIENEKTECNYVILVFLIGVIYLMLSSN